MHGLIHLGLQQMLSEQLGGDVWSRICRKAEIDATEFVNAINYYHDDKTFRILANSADEFGFPIGEFLDQFGFYWVGFVSRGQYASLLASCGKELGEFLINVNCLHSSMSKVLPMAKTGLFEVQEQDLGLTRVRYLARRADIDRLVIGLIRGVCNYLKLECDIELVNRDTKMVELLVKTHKKNAQ